MTALNRILCCALLLIGTAIAANDVDRKIREQSQPVYPEIAKKMNLHGAVKLRLWVTPEGNVTRVEYLGGHPLLADSAIQAVRTWKFEKSAAETTSVVEVKF